MSEAEEKALRKLATIEAPFQVWSLLDSMFSMISKCVKCFPWLFESVFF